MLSRKNGTGFTISDENDERLFNRDYRELALIDAINLIGFKCPF